jgi:hypothetical protein
VAESIAVLAPWRAAAAKETKENSELVPVFRFS